MTCEKVKFNSKENADFIRLKYKKSDEFNRTYLCKCGSWHITSKPLISDVIKELNDKIDALEIDNIAYKEQLVEQIKNNVDLKAEIELLKKFKNKLYSEPQDVKILRHKLNKAKEKIANQTKDISTLLNKLNQFKA